MSLPSWRRPAGRTGGEFEGEEHGSQVSFFVVDNEPGRGPDLHRHPYSETFVVLAGSGRFHRDGEEIEAAAGDVVVVEPGQAHGFKATGDERLEMVAIHAAPRFDTEWVED